MDKTQEAPLKGSFEGADDDSPFHIESGSDTSSLASLLTNDIGDTVLVSRFDALETDGISLDPRQWSRLKKTLVAFAIAFYTSIFYSGSSIFMVSVPGVMIQYGASQERALLGLSLYVLGYGIGPLLWAPLSEVRWIGRNPVYIFTIVIFVVVSFLTAFVSVHNASGLFALRFFQGFFGSPCLANGGASMHDIFNEQDLPYALGIWIAFAYAGPALGPAIAASFTDIFRWSAPMWFIAYCSVPICLILFFLPETHLPRIMYRHSSYAQISGREEDDHQPHPTNTAFNDSVWATLMDSLIKPIQISFLDPSINFVNLYTSFCYATYYTFFDSLPIAYMTKYGFTLNQVAVACMCIMIGCVIGSAAYFSYIYLVVNPANRAGHKGTQEERLKPALVAVFLIPVGICIFALTSNGKIHWLVSMSGIAIYSGAVFVILQCLCMYMLKSYPSYAASLFAANDAFRSILAAGAVHVGVPFYTRFGVRGGCIILAIISLFGIVGMWLLYWKGAALRARSKFAVS